MNTNPSNTLEQCAYDRGYQARGKGGECENPHKRGSTAHYWWLAGWNKRCTELDDDAK